MENKKILEKEVLTLTELLHHDKCLEGLRKLIKKKELNPNDCILGGFFEDEDGGEYGMIVTKEKKIFSYERDTNLNLFRKWKKISKPSTLIDMFPAAILAYEMMN